MNFQRPIGNTLRTQVAIIGGGNSGIATAYYLARNHGMKSVLIDALSQPMAYTSAQSGENYRNWWPHPLMTAFTNRSIDLLEEIASADHGGRRISMTRRGYLLATRHRGTADQLLQKLDATMPISDIRIHDKEQSKHYKPPTHADWESAPSGVDVLLSRSLISDAFPSIDAEGLEAVFHIRRAGDISGQQLGSFQLDFVKAAGGKLLCDSTVERIVREGQSFVLELAPGNKTGVTKIVADRLVNAAGPKAQTVANMLGVDLPIVNVFHQKVAFEDKAGVVPRNLPFCIDLDPQLLNWSKEDRDALEHDDILQWLTGLLPGSVHCRPDGGDHGQWVKLGWAYNNDITDPSWDSLINLSETFPEIVVRAASRLQPGLKMYLDGLPRNRHHYGGWYSMTSENWPLIGPMGELDGAFMNAAPSGFGTMTSCAAGELTAAWVSDSKLPSYATTLSMARYQDLPLMEDLRALDKGLL